MHALCIVILSYHHIITSYHVFYDIIILSRYHIIIFLSYHLISSAYHSSCHIVSWYYHNITEKVLALKVFLLSSVELVGGQRPWPLVKLSPAQPSPAHDNDNDQPSPAQIGALQPWPLVKLSPAPPSPSHDSRCAMPLWPFFYNNFVFGARCTGNLLWFWSVRTLQSHFAVLFFVFCFAPPARRF